MKFIASRISDVNNLFLALFLFVFSNLNAQYFNNSNSELSYQLIEKNDSMEKYRTFIVIDELSDNDFNILENWDKITIIKKESIIDNWFYEGKRIEVESYPYLSYKPIFNVKIKNPKIIETN
jgi:hypothetical protein